MARRMLGMGGFRRNIPCHQLLFCAALAGWLLSHLELAMMRLLKWTRSCPRRSFGWTRVGRQPIADPGNLAMN
jgi:hypothetical protein